MMLPKADVDEDTVTRFVVESLGEPLSLAARGSLPVDRAALPTSG